MSDQIAHKATRISLGKDEHKFVVGPRTERSDTLGRLTRIWSGFRQRFQRSQACLFWCTQRINAGLKFANSFGVLGISSCRKLHSSLCCKTTFLANRFTHFTIHPLHRSLHGSLTSQFTHFTTRSLHAPAVECERQCEGMRREEFVQVV